MGGYYSLIGNGVVVVSGLGNWKVCVIEMNEWNRNSNNE